MDFDQLTTFVEVAKLRSFSRAGQKLFRSQPAVSAQIRLLEQEYGEKLLDRAGKSVRLTTAGAVLFDYAGRMLNLRNESLHAVNDQSATHGGTLNIGANEATCLYVLPEIFAQYHQLYPQVQISIYRNFSRKVLEKLEDSTIDVGIVTLPVKSRSLRVHSIFRDKLMLMVSTKNPLAKKKAVTRSDVAEQPLILPKTGFTRQLLDRYFRPYRSRLRITMELPSVTMIKRFVAANLGVSLISRSYALEEVRSGEVKLIALDDLELWRELGLVYRRDRTLARATTSFIALVKQRAGLDAESHRAHPA